MHRKSLVTLLLVVLCNVSAADDAADVDNAVDTLYRSLAAKDLKGLAVYIPSDGFTEFNPEHKDLQTMDMRLFKGAFDAGVAINLHVEQLKARVLGRTAIVTGYRVGSITFPDGRVVNDRSCLTMNWTKDKTWTLQHVHLSQCAVD
jgi:ketosteroid isomerase-like protein